ncbi:hypothetical protein Vafri_13455 [Volvox africanus]|nr:hypothetical protein Vafri_13455 [Volvox africanus]
MHALPSAPDGYPSSDLPLYLHAETPLTCTQGAHHLDLMFSNPADPPSVRAARQMEMRHVRRWIDQSYEMRQKRSNSTDIRVPGQGRGTSTGADASMAESATASVA